MIGSEGTLGVITAATLLLHPPPQVHCTALIAVDNLSMALKILTQVHQQHYSLLAFEFFSNECLEVVCQKQSLRPPFPSVYPYYVLLEFEKNQEKMGIEAWLESLIKGSVIADTILAYQPTEQRSLWLYRERITESLASCGTVYKNDLSLPLRHLPFFVEKLLAAKNILYANHQVFLFGHLGDGNVHVNVLNQNVDSQTFIQNCEASNHPLFELVRQYGGSIAAEHGIGLLKKIISSIQGRLVKLSGCAR